MISPQDEVKESYFHNFSLIVYYRFYEGKLHQKKKKRKRSISKLNGKFNLCLSADDMILYIKNSKDNPKYLDMINNFRIKGKSLSIKTSCISTYYQ